MNSTIKTTHKCSFCGKHNQQVRHMVAGNGVSICDECVLGCVEVIMNGPENKEVIDESSI